MTDNTQAPLPNLPCVILAGGQSRRFGSNKALAEFRGKRLIDHVIHRLEMQTAGPIAINAAPADEYRLLSLPFIADRLTGNIGPLAGLHAALCWASDRGFDHVLTCPVDTPLLPDDFIAQLQQSGLPSVAAYQGRVHALHGIWPVALREELEKAIADGLRAARVWKAACQANDCVFAAAAEDPFLNINRPEDLI